MAESAAAGAPMREMVAIKLVPERGEAVELRMPKDVLFQESPVLANALGAGDWTKSEIPRCIEVQCKDPDTGALFFRFMMHANHVRTMVDLFPSCYCPTASSLIDSTLIAWKLPALHEMFQLAEYYHAPKVQLQIMESLKGFLGIASGRTPLEFVSAVEARFAPGQEFDWGFVIYKKLVGILKTRNRNSLNDAYLATCYKRLTSDSCLTAKLSKTTLLRIMSTGLQDADENDNLKWHSELL